MSESDSTQSASDDELEAAFSDSESHDGEKTSEQPVCKRQALDWGTLAHGVSANVVNGTFCVFKFLVGRSCTPPRSARSGSPTILT